MVARDMRKVAIKTRQGLHIFSCLHEGLSNDDVEAARSTVIQEIRPGAGFKNVDFVNEMLGEGGLS